MRAQELHQTAVYLRERYSPPDATMTPGKYVSHEAMHALADALDRTGDDVAEHAVETETEAPRVVRAARLPLDDEFLRREALDLAVRAQRGQEGGAEIVARAEILLGFLRGNSVSREAQEDAAWKYSDR